MNKIPIVLMLLALSAVYMPQAIGDGPGWTADSVVDKLVVTTNGGVNVKLSPVLYGCVSQSGYGPYYASIYPDHPG